MRIRKAVIITTALLVSLAPGRASAASTADLEVGVTGSPDPVPLGGLITWTIRVANLGPHEATGVRLEAFYGSDASAVSATATQGTCEPTGDSVAYSLGTIPAGATVTTTAVMQNWGGDGASLHVLVSSASEDPVTSNNEVSRQVDVLPGPGETRTPTGLFCPPTGGISTGGGGTARGSPGWLPDIGLVAMAAVLVGAIRLARR